MAARWTFVPFAESPRARLPILIFIGRVEGEGSSIGHASAVRDRGMGRTVDEPRSRRFAFVVVMQAAQLCPSTFRTFDGESSSRREPSHLAGQMAIVSRT